MKYDRKIHITTEQLADLMGVSVSNLAGGLASRGGPKALFRATVNGRQQSVYCRFLAVAWVDELRTADLIKKQEHKELVPPRTIRPLQEQGVYRPSPALRENFRRAGELYPHRLITPEGVGNTLQLMYNGHQKARL